MEPMSRFAELADAVAAEVTLLRIPSRPELIEPTVEYLRHKAILCGACHEGRAGKVMLALQEALSNAVIHGNLEVSSDLKEREDDSFARALAERAADPAYASREVEIHVDYDGQRCRWTITDQGPGFDVEQVLRRVADGPEAMLASGRGLLMIRAFMDEVHYTAGGRRLQLTLHRASGQERRRDERVALHEAVQVAPLGEDGTADWKRAYEAVSWKLSSRGMAILQAQLATDARIVIGIGSLDQRVDLAAEVRHWRAVGENLIELGCRFQSATDWSAAELPADLAAAVAGLIDRCGVRREGEPERRLLPRACFTGPVQVYPASGGAPLTGFARDLSKGGLALIATAPVAPGPVVLVLPEGEGRPALQIRAEVVRCTNIMASFFDVGVRFLGLASG